MGSSGRLDVASRPPYSDPNSDQSHGGGGDDDLRAGRCHRQAAAVVRRPAVLTRTTAGRHCQRSDHAGGRRAATGRADLTGDDGTGRSEDEDVVPCGKERGSNANRVLMLYVMKIKC